jgi:hypothetical protein
VVTIFLRVLGACLGAFAIVFGEADDSPGLQGIGLLLVLAVFFSLFKIVKRN